MAGLLIVGLGLVLAERATACFFSLFLPLGLLGSPHHILPPGRIRSKNAQIPKLLLPGRRDDMKRTPLVRYHPD